MRGTFVAGALLLLGLLAPLAVGQSPYPPSGNYGTWKPTPGYEVAAPQMGQPVYGDPRQVVRSYEEHCRCNDPEATFWIMGEYLAWWIRGANLPPLLTASVPGTPQASAGVLGTPGTAVLAGGERVNGDHRSGARVRLGLWLDDDQNLGLEGGFFLLEGQGRGFVAGSADGSQIVSRPFFDATTGQANAELVSFPGVLAGFSTVSASSSNLWGAEGGLRYSLCCGNARFVGDDGCPGDNGYFALDAIAGYRWLSFQDQVVIQEDLQPLGDLFVPGTRILIRDDFWARNRFHGGYLGVAGDMQIGRWSAAMRARASVGQVERQVRIGGVTQTQVPGAATVTNAGGLLALVSNIGSYSSSQVTILPEADLWLGYSVTENMRLVVGYSFIYWPRVVRAGEQIDPVVNPNLLPPVQAGAVGPSRPAFNFRYSDMWVQGVSAGIQLAF